MLRREVHTAITLAATASMALVGVGVIIGFEAAPSESEAPPPSLEPAVTPGSLTMSTDLSHHALTRTGEHTVWARISLEAGDAPEGGRPPLDLALIVDRSGSMRGEKMAHAQKAARALVEQMSPGDRIALVSFSDRATLEHDLAPVDEQQARILSSIGRLYPTGSTSITSGYVTGLRALAQNPGRSTRTMFLLSDGVANVDEIEPEELASRAARGLTIDEAHLTTIGIGDDFDETSLGRMAVEGGGNFHYVDTPRKLETILKEEWAGLANAAAGDVELRLTPTTGVTIGKVYGFNHRRQEGAVVVRPDMMYARAKRHVIVELRVDAAALAGGALVDVELRYDDVTSDPAARRQAQNTIRVRRKSGAMTVADEDRNILAHVRRVLSADAVDRYDQLRVEGLEEDAARTLTQAEQANRDFVKRHGPTKALEPAIRLIDEAKRPRVEVVQEKRQIRIRKARKAQTIEIIRGEL